MARKPLALVDCQNQFHFWKNNFQQLLTIRVYQNIWRFKMARLPEGEKQQRKGQLARLFHRCRLGLSEQEVAEEMEWDRRTANNYLRELDEEGKVHRNGRKWFPG